MTFSWTQPICEPCWDLDFPNRKPAQMMSEFRQMEVCCKCNGAASAGIYIRINPSEVKFPTLEK